MLTAIPMSLGLDTHHCVTSATIMFVFRGEFSILLTFQTVISFMDSDIILKQSCY